MPRCLQLVISVFLAGIATTITYANTDKTQAKEDIFTSNLIYKSDQHVQEGRRVQFPSATSSSKNKRSFPPSQKKKNSAWNARAYISPFNFVNIFFHIIINCRERPRWFTKVFESPPIFNPLTTAHYPPTKKQPQKHWFHPLLEILKRFWRLKGLKTHSFSKGQRLIYTKMYTPKLPAQCRSEQSIPLTSTLLTSSRVPTSRHICEIHYAKRKQQKHQTIYTNLARVHVKQFYYHLPPPFPSPFEAVTTLMYSNNHTR